MFAAILVDRPAISMRNLAIAAFIVLALEPEGIIEPGFQMSFAAVAALIAGVGGLARPPRARGWRTTTSLPGYRLAAARSAGALMGVASRRSSPGFATAPFAAYHFERVATYSLLGNLLAAPLVSAIIMPFGLLTLVADAARAGSAAARRHGAGASRCCSRSPTGSPRLPGAEVTRAADGAASLLLIAARHALALPLAAALAASRPAGDRRSGLS